MKPNILRSLLAVILLSVASASSLVASSGVSVTLLGYTIDSALNVNLGYTLTINTIVRNTDSVNGFVGLLDFGLRNDAQVLSTTTVFKKPPYSGGNQITLAPNESVPAIFSVNINPQYFSPGPDVVVVWPICTSPITDSVRIPLNIIGPSGVGEEKADGFTYIITDRKILLQNTGTQTNFKQVRIVNLWGQTISSLSSNFISEIPVADLPKGIYLCEITGSNNLRKVIKFFH